MMLMLTRKRGQETTVGDLVLRLDEFNSRGARFTVLTKTGRMCRTTEVPMERAFYLAAGVYVVPKEAHGNQLRLGIQAPKDVPIQRDDIKKPKRELAHG